MKLKLLMVLLFVVNAFAITTAEKKALNYMYQEEKLAKDVYRTLGNMYPQVRVFKIYRAEIMHETSVKNVMKHYNMPLPIRGNKIGVFKNQELQHLYNQLIAKGKKSLKDALEVGIMVEVTDVEDLDKYLSKATSPDIRRMFTFIRAGSYNHYNAFNRALQYYAGASACKLMSKRWCQEYPFKRGLGRAYRNAYWFPKFRMRER